MTGDNSIKLEVAFSASNQVVLQQVNQGLSQTASNLANLRNQVLSGGAAISALQNQFNLLANGARTGLGNAFSYVSQVAGNLFGVLQRLALVGIGAFVGAMATAVYSLKQLGSEFIKVNEQFATLEITLKSAFNSLTVAKELGAEIQKISVTSPLSLQSLADITRSAATIPFLRQSIAAQGFSPGGYNDPNGQFQRLISLVEKMLASRPDKDAESAIFALRQALAGQFRSLVLRFGIPASEFGAVTSGGTTRGVTSSPDKIFQAVEAFYNNLITPQAVQELTRQPTVMFQKVLQEIIQIPLLNIGQSGLYEKFTTTVASFYMSLSDFVSNRFAPYAKRISDALGSAFDNVIKGLSGGYDSLLHIVGQGSVDRPGVSVFDRSAQAVTAAAEYAAKAIPSLIENVTKFFAAIKPVFSAVAEVIEFLAKAVEKFGPIETYIGYQALKASIAPTLQLVGGQIQQVIGSAIAQGAAAYVNAMPSAYGATTAAGKAVNVASVLQQRGGAYFIPAGIQSPLRGSIPLSSEVPVTAGLAASIQGAEGAATRAGLATALSEAVTGLGAFALQFGVAVGIFAAAAYAWNKFQQDADAVQQKGLTEAINGAPLRPSSVDAIAGLVSSYTTQANSATQGWQSPSFLMQGLGPVSNTLGPMFNPESMQRTWLQSLLGVGGNPGERLGATTVSFSSLDQVEQDTQRLASFYKRLMAITIKDVIPAGENPFGVEVRGDEPERIKGELSELGQILIARRNFASDYLGVDVSKAFNAPFTSYVTDANRDKLNQYTIGAGKFLDTPSLLANHKDILGGYDQLNQLLTEVNASDESTTNSLGSFAQELKKKLGLRTDTDGIIESLKKKADAVEQAQELIDKLGATKIDPSSILAEIESYIKTSKAGLVNNDDSVTAFEKSLTSAQLDSLSTSLKSGALTGGLLSKGQSGVNAANVSIAANSTLAAIARISEFFNTIGNTLKGSELAKLQESSVMDDVSQLMALAKLPSDQISQVSSQLKPLLDASFKDSTIIGKVPQQQEDIRALGAQVQLMSYLADFYSQLAQNNPTLINSTQLTAAQNALQFSQSGLATAQQNYQNQVTGNGFFKSLGGGFSAVTTEWKESAFNMAEVGQGIAKSISSSFDQAFSSIIQGSKNAGQAFEEMGLHMLQTVANLFADKAFQSLAGSLFGALGGAAGGAVGAGAGTGEGAIDPAIASLRKSTGSLGGGVNVSITYNEAPGGGASEKQSSSGKETQGKEFARTLKAGVLQIIQQERRAGGTLSRSGGGR
jgi:hypothetical protein